MLAPSYVFDIVSNKLFMFVESDHNNIFHINTYRYNYKNGETKRKQSIARNPRLRC